MSSNGFRSVSFFLLLALILSTASSGPALAHEGHDHDEQPVMAAPMDSR